MQKELHMYQWTNIKGQIICSNCKVNLAQTRKPLMQLSIESWLNEVATA